MNRCCPISFQTILPPPTCLRLCVFFFFFLQNSWCSTSPSSLPCNLKSKWDRTLQVLPQTFHQSHHGNFLSPSPSLVLVPLRFANRKSFLWGQHLARLGKRNVLAFPPASGFVPTKLENEAYRELEILLSQSVFASFIQGFGVVNTSHIPTKWCQMTEWIRAEALGVFSCAVYTVTPEEVNIKIN